MFSEKIDTYKLSYYLGILLGCALLLWTLYQRLRWRPDVTLEELWTHHRVLVIFLWARSLLKVLWYSWYLFYPVNPQEGAWLSWILRAPGMVHLYTLTLALREGPFWAYKKFRRKSWDGFFCRWIYKFQEAPYVPAVFWVRTWYLLPPLFPPLVLWLAVLLDSLRMFYASLIFLLCPLFFRLLLGILEEFSLRRQRAWDPEPPSPGHCSQNLWLKNLRLWKLHYDPYRSWFSQVLYLGAWSWFLF